MFTLEGADSCHQVNDWMLALASLNSVGSAINQKSTISSFFSSSRKQVNCVIFWLFSWAHQLCHEAVLQHLAVAMPSYSVVQQQDIRTFASTSPFPKLGMLMGRQCPEKVNPYLYCVQHSNPSGWSKGPIDGLCRGKRWAQDGSLSFLPQLLSLSLPWQVRPLCSLIYVHCPGRCPLLLYWSEGV